MNPKVTVFTPSFNKKQYVGDAIESVLSQTYTNIEYMIIENSTDTETRKIVEDYAIRDFRIRYIVEDFTPEERKTIYPTTVLLNKYYPKVRGEYVLFLSDDDLLYLDCVEKMVAFMEEKKCAVAWHTQAITKQDEYGEWQRINVCKADMNRGYDTPNLQVDCMMDGGQIMHRKDCLDKLSQPYFPTDLPSAAHCDGVFMEKLAKHFTFYGMGVGLILSEHRRTNVSSFVKSTDP